MDRGAVLGGKYRLARRLGGGGMGELWVADDLKLNRRIAIKIVAPAQRDSPQFAARLQREAQSAASLGHHGITVVHDMGEHEGRPYFVMELLEGRDFKALLADSPGGLAPVRAVSLMRSVADALAYAHGKGVVHRDIKPANLMELAEGGVKICDFGIARYADVTTDLTPTGQFLGTPAYVAPEHYQGLRSDERSDMYSFGCTLHALLTGDPPFTGPTMAAYIHQHLHVAPPALRDVRPGTPPDLERLVLDLLAKDPADRPAATDVLTRLTTLSTETSTSHSTAVPARTVTEGAAGGATTGTRMAPLPVRDPEPPVSGSPPYEPTGGTPGGTEAHSTPSIPMESAPDEPPPDTPPRGNRGRKTSAVPASRRKRPAPRKPARRPPAKRNGRGAAQRSRHGGNSSLVASLILPLKLYEWTAAGVGSVFRAYGSGSSDMDPAWRRDGPALALLGTSILLASVTWFRPSGVVTAALERVVRGGFGLLSVVLPLVMLFFAMSVFRCFRLDTGRVLIGLIAMGVGVLGILHISAGAPGPAAHMHAVRAAGGVIGWLVAAPMAAVLTGWGAVPLLALVAFFGLLVLTATPIQAVPRRLSGLWKRGLGKGTESHDEEPTLWP